MPSSRLPKTSDFSQHLKLSITSPPSTSSHPTNVLILLHGIGDTSVPFTQLGKQLNLPETVCISLQAPTPLPFDLGGFHWGDDIIFDQATGQLDSNAGFSKASTVIKKEIIEDCLVGKCGYVERDVSFFGLGQGAMVAMAVASSPTQEFGGVISVGGPLATISSNHVTAPTPILVFGGSSNTAITRTALQNLRTAFKNVEYHKWDRPGDAMPSSREEMLPIMRFFARRLKSRQGVPEGSVEIG